MPYRLTAAHRAWLEAASALTDPVVGDASVTVADVHAWLLDHDDGPAPSFHSLRRMTEGLVRHGYIERISRGRNKPSRYRLTAKADDFILSEAAHG